MILTCIVRYLSVSLERTMFPANSSSEYFSAERRLEWSPLHIGSYLPTVAELIIFSASSMVKLFGFWTGGNSLKVAAHLSAIA